MPESRAAVRPCAPESTLLAACGLALAAAGLAHGQATITAIEPPTGYAEVWTTDVSGDGSTIVGYATGSGRGPTPILWDAMLTPTVLGPLPGDTHAYPSHLTADGTRATGVSVFQIATLPGTSRAALWNADGSSLGLGALPGDDYSSASGISADGSVIAGTSDGPGGERAFVWTPAGGMVALDAPAGSTRVQAGLVSADGRVIAGSIQTDEGTGIVRWIDAGEAQEIGALPGDPFATPYAISADGSTIVGFSGRQTGSSRMVRWTEAGGLEDLGVLPGRSRNRATDVSGDGSVVVGYGEAIDVFRAAMWTRSTGLVDLNTYLPTLGVDLGGWTLRHVQAISDDATVMTGSGVLDGQIRAFVIRDLPPLVPCAADLDADGTLTIFDFLEFGNLFDAMDPRADFDGDGDFTIFDFLAFQNAFDAGCP